MGSPSPARIEILQQHVRFLLHTGTKTVIGQDAQLYAPKQAPYQIIQPVLPGLRNFILLPRIVIRRLDTKGQRMPKPVPPPEIEKGDCLVNRPQAIRNIQKILSGMIGQGKRRCKLSDSRADPAAVHPKVPQKAKVSGKHLRSASNFVGTCVNRPNPLAEIIRFAQPLCQGTGGPPHLFSESVVPRPWI